MKKLVNILNHIFNKILILTFITTYSFTQDLLKTNSQNSVLVSRTITLKILLVEFKDVKHRNPNYPANLKLPAYTFDDFNNLFFSENKYVSPNMYSPDGKEVFGSFRDYYRIMSNNNLNITGCVVNRDSNNDNIPDWIVLDSNKAYYDSCRGEEFRKEAKLKAIAIGLDIFTNDNTFLAIIYAGHTYRSWSNTLNPQAFYNPHEYIMGERFACGAPYREERDDPAKNSVSHFAHIGIHVHEFCHLLGFCDLFGITSNYNWGLMSTGNYNGPNNEGACPAPINPFFRWKCGWISFKTFNKSTTAKLKYNIQDPEIYYLDNKTYPYNFFLVEFRKMNSEIKLGDFLVKDYNTNNRNVKSNYGVLIWRKLYGDVVKLLYSSAINNSDGDGQIFPGKENVLVISPWSDCRDVGENCFWIPNTKPSENCAIEIKEISEEFCFVDLYQNQDEIIEVSPSCPKNLKVEFSSSVKFIWNKNLEPDLNHYKIYKKSNNSKYILFDSTRFSQYVDNSETTAVAVDSNSYVNYKITAVDKEGKESTFSKEIKIYVERKEVTNISNSEKQISNFKLFQNYPNPFNPSTNINYELPKQAKVVLKVFDVLGKEIATLVNEIKSAGNYSVEFNVLEFPNNSSGVYFFRLFANDFVETKKGMFIK